MKDINSLINKIQDQDSRNVRGGSGTTKKVLEKIVENLEQLNEAGFVTKDVDDLENYNTKTQEAEIYATKQQLGGYYTKEQTDAMLATLGNGSYVVAWDGSSEPVVANIPAGVTVTYDGTNYTGTLDASASTKENIYLVGQDMYITSVNDSTYSWLAAGTTELDLSGYATDAELSQLEAKVEDQFEIVTEYDFNGTNSVATLDQDIVLSQNGDSIEISYKIDSGIQAYSFTNSGTSASNYYAIILGSTLVGARTIDGNSWFIPQTSISSVTTGVMKVVYENNIVNFYINGVVVASSSSQKTIQIHSFGNGGNAAYGYWGGAIYYIKVNGQDFNLYRNATFTNVVIKKKSTRDFPKGVLRYDMANKKFTFFSQRSGTKYFSFIVQHLADHSDMVYFDGWRLIGGNVCEYDGNDFAVGDSILYSAENEMAMHFAGKADYTGGLHGDERIDIDPSSLVKFFADGQMLRTDIADFELECSNFSYFQISTLHETSSDGVTPVSGHPIIAYHLKRTSVANAKLTTENTVKMASTQRVDQAHCGLLCIGKATASYALLPAMVISPELTGTDNDIPANDLNASIVEMWQPAKFNRVVVDSEFLEGFNNTTDIKQLSVWDRVNDSKYYRRTNGTKEFATDSVIRNRQTAEFF